MASDSETIPIRENGLYSDLLSSYVETFMVEQIKGATSNLDA